MCARVLSIPVTVKCRVGVDDHEGYDFLRSFVDRAANTGGVGRFIIHARKALLNLNTKDNRKIPTLQPELAYQLKRDFPDLRLEFNGEVRTEEDIRRHLAHGMDGKRARMPRA